MGESIDNEDEDEEVDDARTEALAEVWGEGFVVDKVKCACCDSRWARPRPW